AEDGIRDRTVTGVQTCALPILRRQRWLSRLGRMRLVAHHQYSGNGLLSELPLLCASALRVLHRQHDVERVRHCVWKQHRHDIYQIGRASCREREEISEVAGAVK